MQAQLKQNIVDLVKQKGWSVSKLEKNAGLTKNYLSNLLRDKSRNPGIDAIAKIAAALQISIDELFGNESKHEYKIHDLVITRKDIFSEVINYLLTSIHAHKKKEIEFDRFVAALYEIYVFSLKEGMINKRFADWYISNQL